MPVQTSLVEALCSDVSRKLRLASEAETKDDREIVCEEVFCDVTGYLDEAAQAQLGAHGRVPFYVVLAQYLATPRGADSAVAVLHLLQSLYSQGHAAPLVALLLHRWLLIRRAPGRGLPEEQRTRVAIALASGSSQLFLGDVHGGKHTFEPLWTSLCYEVILGEEAMPWEGDRIGSITTPGGSAGAVTSPPAPQAVTRTRSVSSGMAGNNGTSGGGAVTGLASLSSTARTGLLARVAAFLVYYAQEDELEDLLKRFPSPTAPPSPSLPMQASTSSLLASNYPSTTQEHTLDDPATTDPRADGGSRGASPTHASRVPAKLPPLASPPWGGVDFIMMEITDMLGKIKSEGGLVEYLRAVQRLRGQPALQNPDGMRLDTRLKLQSTLSTLASEGGPHYAPRAVRREALAALDSLFPTGLGSRRLVRALFRLLHPADWAGDCLSSCLNWIHGLLAAIPLAAFRFLHSLVLWGVWGRAPAPQQQPFVTASVSDIGRWSAPSNGAREGTQQQRRVVADATGWPTAAAGGVPLPQQPAPGIRWRGGQTGGQPSQPQGGSPKAREAGRAADGQGRTGAAGVLGMSSRAVAGDADGASSMSAASPHKQSSPTAQPVAKPPGSPRVMAEQFLAGARSAVGSTAQAVESGVKAMGAYASRLAGGGRPSLEGVEGGGSGVGSDQNSHKHSSSEVRQPSITNVDQVLAQGR